MPECTLSRAEARAYLIRYHGLDGKSGWRGLDGVRRCFARLHSVQFDPLDVVGRNAELTLQARVAGCRRGMLETLLYRERSLVDGYDKMLCVYEAKDYARFARVRARAAACARGTLAWRGQLDALALTDDVLAAVRDRGPLCAGDLDLGERRALARGSWGHRKLSSAALDYLYARGDLCVYGKRGTQKIYGLTERTLPAAYLGPDPFPDDDAFFRWYLLRRVECAGMLWDKSGGGWLSLFPDDRALRKRILGQLVERGSLLRLSVEGSQVPFYLPAAHASLLEGAPAARTVRFLAPLDMLLWDRAMVKFLFDFEYSWEVYVPQNKRKYGYYVLPVLCGDRLAARFEPAPYRPGGGFAIRQWWWEDGVRVTKGLERAVDDASARFAAFLASGEG